MAEPYNYNVASPMAGFVQGLNVGTVLDEQRKAQEVEQRAREGEAALLAAFEGGTPTTTQISDLILKNPSIADRAKQAYTMRTASQREADERQRTQLYMLMRSGETEAVKAQMQTFIDAARNSGRTQEAAQGEANLRVYEQNPNAGMISIGATLAATNPDLWKKLSETEKTQAEIVGVGATTAKTKAETEKTASEIAKLAVETRLKEIDEKFAPQKFLADLGLTAAQTASARGSAEASRASAAASRATTAREAAQTGQIRAGVIPSEKRPEAEGKLRKEYSDQTKSYQDVKSAYSRITASQDNAAGDLSLIFNYMKMLDPGSTVREGEFASAQNATGVPSRVLNVYNNVISGERLNTGQRQQFVGQAKTLYSQARVQENTVRKGVERIAKGYGLDPQNIFYEAVESTPVAPAVAPVAPTPSGLMPAQKAVLSRADAILARGRK
jgi:hypothetical protein